MILQKFLFVSLIALISLSFAGCSSQSSSAITKESDPSISFGTENTSSESTLFPVKTISHSHGLSVDINDKNKIYIATHDGLLLLKSDKELFRIGDTQDDFMGFSTHPNEPKTFFTSGHPKSGGNLGIQQSNDGGMSWKKLSDGVFGPVDFHSMTLSPANPSLFYGWFGGKLQRSTDGGKNWKIIPSTLQQVISITADPHQENNLYAATSNGLQISKDKGEKWSEFSKELSGEAVTAVAIDPLEDQNMLLFSLSLGLLRSTNAGNSWENIQQEIGQVLYFAFDPNTSNTVYALNRNNSLFKSIDGGLKWDLIR